MPQHLYITSDGEIKENDWCIIWNAIGTNMLVQYNDGKYYHRFQHNGKGYNTEEEVKGRYNKIIATTDKELINNKASGEIYPEWNYDVAQIPESFIKEYCDKGSIDEVMVEYIYNQDVLDQYNKEMNYENNSCVDLSDGVELKLTENNEIIINLVEEKMLPLSEVERLCRLAHKNCWVSNNMYSEKHGENPKYSINNWIKENL